MAFETAGTFNPAARNPQNGAVGLLQFQFVPESLDGLTTDSGPITTDTLAAMTPLEQLDVVEQYLAAQSQRHGRLGTSGDVYGAVMWPAMIGKPDDYVLMAGDSASYRENGALDIDGDGKITRQEAVAKVRRMLVRGMQPENLASRPSEH